MDTFLYGQDHLTVPIALSLARGDTKGILGPRALERIHASRRLVEEIVAGEKIVYGINTGFGPLCTTVISRKDTEKLQENICYNCARINWALPPVY